jgi:hypothetical protein
MKIKYVHSSDPNTEKVMDSREQQRADESFRRIFCLKHYTPEEYDRYLLEKLEKDKAKGRIIRYEIVEDKGEVADRT